VLNISWKYDIWVYISNQLGTHTLRRHNYVQKVEGMVLVSKIPSVNLNANIVMWLYVWINGPLALQILRSCMSSYHSSSPRVRLGLVFSPWTSGLHPHTVYKQKEKRLLIMPTLTIMSCQSSKFKTLYNFSRVPIGRGCGMLGMYVMLVWTNWMLRMK